MDMDALERRARDVLAPGVYDYYAGGAETETTLAESGPAWRRWRLRPRVLRDVSVVSTSTELLGTPVATPIGVAPWALQRMAHPEGERATARGATAAGALMTVSTAATCSLEDVALVDSSPRWFQLYRRHSPDYTDELVRRAAAAGYAALVVTVDLPLLGRRLRDLRNDFLLPEGIVLANEVQADSSGGARLGSALSLSGTASWTYDDLARFVGLTAMPVVVKGVLRGDDAQRCVDAGARGVWVSTHGGRQVDPAVASAVALPEVVAAVGSDVEVYVDGGVRHGSDVLTALALGARGVFLGRPTAWGLTLDGADGVRDVLTGLTAELAHTMALCGVASVREATADLVTPA